MLPWPPSGTRLAGYTLVEMMITLSMIALLASLGAWRMVPAYEHAKVRKTVTILSADLQFAQLMAARQRRPVVILVNESLKMYLIRDRSGTTVYRQRFVGEDTDFGIQLLEVEPSTSIQVFPNGATLSTATFTVGLKDYARQVALTRAGHIRILPL